MGEIRIGTANSVCIYFLPRVLWTMREKYSLTRPTVLYRHSNEILDLLGSNRLDVALVANPRPDRRLRQETIGMLGAPFAAATGALRVVFLPSVLGAFLPVDFAFAMAGSFSRLLFRWTRFSPGHPRAAAVVRARAAHLGAYHPRPELSPTGWGLAPGWPKRETQHFVGIIC